MSLRWKRWVPRGHGHLLSPDADTGIRIMEKLGVSMGTISPEISFGVSLSPPDRDTYPSVPVKVWKDCPVAYGYGRLIPQSFRHVISPAGSDARPLTLVRVNPSHHRQIFRNAPRKEEVGFQPATGFADAYPIHLLHLASVRDVAPRGVGSIPEIIDPAFWANVVVQGPAAFEEDHWKRIRLWPQNSNREDDGNDGIGIYTVCRTVRCCLPNIDPDTGIRHPSEPDRTLKSYRRIDLGCEMYACLGMLLVPSVQGESPLLCRILADR